MHTEDLEESQFWQREIPSEDVKEQLLDQQDEIQVKEEMKEIEVVVGKLHNSDNYEEASHPLGEEVEEIIYQAKKDSLSHKGCTRAWPYKISRCLKRMEEIMAENSHPCKRCIATKVSQEFSTVPRYC